MSTVSGKLKVLSDVEIRIISTGSVASVGAAQNKGTCTDLLLVVASGPDGATAVGGTTNVIVQGSNVTASAASNWTNVTPDKGTLAAVTASGQQVVHYAQLQSQYYRVSVNCTTGATADVSAVWVYHPVEDSFDATVQ